MSIWEVLNINETTDKREIKKAYVRLLKENHPEDNQEGFIKLREAYEHALSFADSVSRASLSVKSDDNMLIDMKLQNEVLASQKDEEEIVEAKKINIEWKYNHFDHKTEIENVFRLLTSLYGDIFKRRNIESWRKLFLNISLNEYQQLCRNAYLFFNDNFHLTHDIWQLLNDELLLSDNFQFRWQGLVQFDYGLNLDCFEPNEELDYESYLNIRFYAFMALRKGKYEDAATKSEEAEKIFKRDPVLFRIKGISYYMLEDNEKSLDAFSKALSLNEEDLDSLLYRGKIMLKKNDFNLAKRDFKKVVKLDPDCIEGSKGIVYALYGLKRFISAGRFAKKLTKKNPQDMELDIMFSKGFGFQITTEIIKYIRWYKVKEKENVFLNLLPVIGIGFLPFILLIILAYVPMLIPIIFILGILYITSPLRRKQRYEK